MNLCFFYYTIVIDFFQNYSSFKVELGGLGICNLRLRNEALLAKWSWRFPLESNALCCRVIVSEYGPHSFECASVYGSKGTFKNPWKTLSVGFPFFPNLVKYSVGDGSIQTLIFGSGSLGDSPFCILFPRLYHLSSLKPCYVASAISCSSNAYSFNFGFRHPLSNREPLNLSTLLPLLRDFHICHRDICFWSPNPCEGFSCSFFLILSSPHTSRNPGKFKIFKKAKSFTWQILYGRVNIMDRIQSHSSLLWLRWCILCRKVFEDLDHVVCRCQLAILTWDSFLETFGVCLARNRDRSPILKEVLFFQLFHDKGCFLWHARLFFFISFYFYFSKISEVLREKCGFLPSFVPLFWAYVIKKDIFNYPLDLFFRLETFFVWLVMLLVGSFFFLFCSFVFFHFSEQKHYFLGKKNCCRKISSLYQ